MPPMRVVLGDGQSDGITRAKEIWTSSPQFSSDFPRFRSALASDQWWRDYFLVDLIVVVVVLVMWESAFWASAT
jgi:hypothetical protein